MQFVEIYISISIVFNNCIIISFIANNDTDFILTSRDEDAHAILCLDVHWYSKFDIRKKKLTHITEINI